MPDAKTGTTVCVLFSSVGHVLIHLCAAFYFVIVLALESDWSMPYHELIELWTLGALMIGAAALPAGMLGDRLGAPVMMAIFFIGMGVCCIGAGYAGDTRSLLLWLTGIGVFAAIYHPVGIPWLVRNAGPATGRVLAVNGIFGSLGGAAAGLTAGWLIDVSGWRLAFIAPGLVSIAVGVALLFVIGKGMAPDRRAAPRDRETTGRGELARIFLILVVTMFLAGLIYHGTQTALPKVFELRRDGLVGNGVFGIGVLVAIVYTVAAFAQLIGGYLADKYPLKNVYVGAILAQVPVLYLAASLGGYALVIVVILMVVANSSALPAENMLLARYTPEKRHGLAFGAKFVLAFGTAPLAVQLVSMVQGRTGEFYWLFSFLALFASISVVAALFLPGAGSRRPVEYIS